MSERKLAPQVLELITSGKEVSDLEFDKILPKDLGKISEVQWSTVRTARIIASMIGDSPDLRFMDLGAGVGKLCLLLALMTRAQISGVERRERLIKIAEEICDQNAPNKVHLIHGDMLDIDWSEYDVLYLYNPFFEHRNSGGTIIDGNIEFTQQAFRRYVDAVQARLSALRLGQRVITFHGYGGKMPETLKQTSSSRVGNGTIAMWENESLKQT